MGSFFFTLQLNNLSTMQENDSKFIQLNKLNKYCGIVINPLHS